jgi:hypothetical protein
MKEMNDGMMKDEGGMARGGGSQRAAVGSVRLAERKAAGQAGPGLRCAAARRTYAAYGRVFGVERAGRSRMFWGVGRGRGARAMFLDKLGCRATREAMQEALDAWAARQGLRPLES